jgi:CSLREA domain-containing protein
VRRFLWFPLRSAVLVLLPLSLAFVQAASAATVQIFGNNTPITITNNTTATPYPSNITVSGVTVNTATKIQVVLSQFSHTYPADVDVLLVGPQGQRCMLMSDAAGGSPVNNVSLTFSSTAATVLPQNTAPVTGGYRPANYGDDANGGDLMDTFPSQGPGTLTNQAADLTVFNLTNPNGTWSLYVVDDASPDAGSIANGWLLLVTVPTVFTVNSTADTNDGVCDADCSLREALALAQNGDLINFSPAFNTPQTINLLTALPDITKSVTIQGPGANLLTVRRDYNAATSFRIFNIAFAISNGVSISGMTITGGNSSGDFGGGIYGQSNLVLTGVHVTGNTAGSSGAGVMLAFADGVFTNCTFSNNRATGVTSAGGGIFFQGDGDHTLRLISSTVSGNESVANGGGGISNGSYNASSRLEITNSTIVNNTGSTGGGIYTFTANPGNTATTTLRNTIVAGNSSNNLGTLNGGGPATAKFTTLGFNLSDNYNGALTPLGTDKTGQPLLGPLSLMGGQTPAHALLAGSPALNAGDASGLATDQRGQPRVFGASADIGAVEMRPIIVSNTQDGGANSLRQAIIDANVNGAGLDDILFSNPLFNTAQTITLTSGELAINTSVMIHGAGANLLTVRRDPAAATDFRIFNIAGDIPSGVAITGMVITGGNAGNGNFGGGINSGSDLALTNVHVTGSMAGSGGGASLTFAGGIFRNCTFSNNSSSNAGGSGGGIFFFGNSGYTLRLVSSTVSGNHSANNGGGIENLSGSSGGNSRIEIVNSTVANNTANGGAGGILTFTQNNAGSTATTTLRNTIVAGNSSKNLATGTSGGGAATFTTLGFNLSDNYNAVLAPLATDIMSATPLLGALADNGGTTPTHALLFGSPALDGGNNSGSGVSVDQRGVTRPIDLAGITNAASSDGTDIGAYEAQTAPPSPTPTPTATATATATATPTATATATPTGTPTPTPGLVGNVSTRLPVGTGDNALIEGFIVQGPAGSTKKIVVRAIGPSLIPFGITDALANPTLEIHDSTSAIVATNDDWKTTQTGGLITSDQTAAITASQVAPSNDLESAIIADLAPGSYTAVVRGLGNTTGTGVVDAYDLSAGSPANLANIATRGLIQAGDKLMIAGFIIRNGSVRAVVRAIGPSLAAFGITNALPDTTLQLRDQNGVIVRENDDWQSDQKTELEATSLQPSDPLEAAVVVTIPPGQYTAQVRGKPETTGTGVVQVYFIP